MNEHIIRSDKIFKIIFSLDNEPALYQSDAIEHEGKLWLVTDWLEHPDRIYQIPARIICLENLRPHRVFDNPLIDFGLGAGLSKSVFEGQHPKPEEAGYVVIEQPDLRFPVPSIR